MKAQAAAEYLVIIAIALTILVPLILYSSQSLISYKEDVKVTTARNVVNKLAESANWVYSQGPPARLTVNVCIPEGVQEISLNKILMFKMKTSAGITDVYRETIATLNGSIPSKSGCYFISLVAHEDYVNITVVE